MVENIKQEKGRYHGSVPLFTSHSTWWYKWYHTTHTTVFSCLKVFNTLFCQDADCHFRSDVV